MLVKVFFFCMVITAAATAILSRGFLRPDDVASEAFLAVKHTQGFFPLHVACISVKRELDATDGDRRAPISDRLVEGG